MHDFATLSLVTHRLDHIWRGIIGVLNSAATDFGIVLDSHLRERWTHDWFYYSGRSLHSCANLCKWLLRKLFMGLLLGLRYSYFVTFWKIFKKRLHSTLEVNQIKHANLTVQIVELSPTAS